MSNFADAPLVTALANGVRVLCVPLPGRESVDVSVFVRAGSRDEPDALAGLSHVVEHMAFKGTTTRDCQRINLDAERLGAEVNAHTDKDHTAYHMRGLRDDADKLVRMLADIVLHGTFPQAELERERQVILQELQEDEDDPLSTAFKLFDRHCFGSHPMARPVIGTRASIERVTRDDLQRYVQQRYSGANLIVGIAGDVDAQALLRVVEDSFGALAAGTANVADPAPYLGGIGARRHAGSSQAHLVLGFPIPTLREPHAAAQVAAAAFGEGMSSPLMDEVRERRGLAYYANCSADVFDIAGQFVIEASTAPEHVDEFFATVAGLLLQRAERVDAVELERARNQIIVRRILAAERPARRLEDAALDLFAFGRVRSAQERRDEIAQVDAQQARAAFAQLLAAPPALALAGRLRSGALQRVRAMLAQRGFKGVAGDGSIDEPGARLPQPVPRARRRFAG